MLFYFACEAAGASAPGIPHALLRERRINLAYLGRIRAARTQTLARHTRLAATATHHSPLVVPAQARTHNHREQFLRDVIQAHLPTQAARRMGPCVRRDDSNVIAAPATHHSSSPRTRGPITTGSSFVRMRSNSIPQHRRHGVWVPASAGTTPMLSPHPVIAREGGRSSIAEELMTNRGAAAYWIPAFAGMTICGILDTAFAGMRIARLWRDV